MTGISVLTIVRNREAHLTQLLEGLRRSDCQPDEVIIVDMGDEPLTSGEMPFPVVVDRMDGRGLPLAKARNRAAELARQDLLLFLDVDCIPLRACVGGMREALRGVQGVVCAEVRYLGPNDARGAWCESDLLIRGLPHPVRSFPETGMREEGNPGLFWSLAFGVHAKRFRDMGGFDETFVGYGAEDTDFGFRAAAAGVPLFFLGGAIVCHQHHDSHEPPIQHLADIVRNANVFKRRWNRWPMEGWLRAFHEMGLVDWTPDRLDLRRAPTAQECAASLTTWPGPLARHSGDRAELRGVSPV